MDNFIEILLDLIVNGSIEMLPNKKVPKWIRTIISLIIISMIMGIIILGIVVLKESLLGGILIIIVGVFLIIGVIIKVKNYMKYTKD